MTGRYTGSYLTAYIYVEVVVSENTTPLKSDTEYLLSVKVLQRQLNLVKHNLYFCQLQ
jgi:hypothetical protein